VYSRDLEIRATSANGETAVVFDWYRDFNDRPGVRFCKNQLAAVFFDALFNSNEAYSVAARLLRSQIFGIPFPSSAIEMNTRPSSCFQFDGSPLRT